MDLKDLTNKYCLLTAEERFRLIAAAGWRGDQAEQQRLIAAGDKIALSLDDHAPLAHAFTELAPLVYMDLLYEAHGYLDLLDGATGKQVGVPMDEEGDGDAGSGGDEVESEHDRNWDLALAAGFLLRTKADGWKLFCQQRNIPPDIVWKHLPGYDYVQEALALAHKAAFVPEGFARWINRIAAAGEAPWPGLPITAEAVAAAIETAFQAQVAWWHGQTSQTA